MSHYWNAMKVKAQMAIAWALPKWLVYWAGIRLFSHASTGQFSHVEASKITMAEALEAWDSKKKVEVS